ncbi:MAG: FkbM family methyltransferase [Anaerolineae bacterium]|nr:FkbM family methyltransferase [Anaerolineae bacterium]
MHPLPLIASVTRWLQARQPDHPLRGLSRVSNLLARLLPAYRGVITFSDGTKMLLNSQQRAERWLIFAGSYQPSVTTWLHRHLNSGAYCIDAGANLGFYSLLMAQKVGSAGQVAVFEANPVLAARLRDQLTLNHFDQAQVVEKAVHDKADTLTFYIASDPGKSSIYADHAKVQGEVQVQAITLDEFIEAAGWTRLDVIKMDIEGNDCYGLLGARQSLTRFRPAIIFEYSASTPADAAAAMIDMLSALRYRLSILRGDGTQTPFDWQTMTKDHVDVIAEPM